jgi:hypothetical protein
VAPALTTPQTTLAREIVAPPDRLAVTAPKEAFVPGAANVPVDRFSTTAVIVPVAEGAKVLELAVRRTWRSAAGKTPIPDNTVGGAVIAENPIVTVPEYG